MKRTFSFTTAAAVAVMLAFSGSALAAKPTNPGGGNGGGGGGGGAAVKPRISGTSSSSIATPGVSPTSRPIVVSSLFRPTRFQIHWFAQRHAWCLEPHPA